MNRASLCRMAMTDSRQWFGNDCYPCDENKIVLGSYKDKEADEAAPADETQGQTGTYEEWVSITLSPAMRESETPLV